MSSHLNTVMFLFASHSYNTSIFFFQSFRWIIIMLKISMAFRYNVLLQKHKNVCCVVLFFYDYFFVYIFMALPPNRSHMYRCNKPNRKNRKRRRRKKQRTEKNKAKEADWTHNKHNNKTEMKTTLYGQNEKLNTNECRARDTHVQRGQLYRQCACAWLSSTHFMYRRTQTARAYTSVASACLFIFVRTHFAFYRRTFIDSHSCRIDGGIACTLFIECWSISLDMV